MKNMMRIGFVAASLSMFSATALGANDESYGYVRDSNGKPVRGDNGDCVQARTNPSANPSESMAECGNSKMAAAPVAVETAKPAATKAPTEQPAAAAPAPESPATENTTALDPVPVAVAAMPVAAPPPAEVNSAAAPEPEPAATQPQPEVITLKGDALFGFNRTEIRPEARKQLSDIASKLKAQQSIEAIVISGHTDAAGPETYNQELSKKRAESVKQFLVNEGVVSKSIVVQALGEERPVASNDTKDGRAQNRRVEILVQSATPPK